MKQISAITAVQRRRKGVVNFVMVERTEHNGDGGGLVCACARACVCARVCACVRTCVRDVFAIYDNTILPRLIMIIIKIICYIS